MVQTCVRRNAGAFRAAAPAGELRRELCSFSILCGMNTGQSTALVGSIGEGYVPVINSEANVALPPDAQVAIRGNSVEAVANAMKEALALSDQELTRRARAAQSHFTACFSIPAFRVRVREIIHTILAE